MKLQGTGMEGGDVLYTFKMCVACLPVLYRMRRLIIYVLPMCLLLLCFVTCSIFVYRRCFCFFAVAEPLQLSQWRSGLTRYELSAGHRAASGQVSAAAEQRQLLLPILLLFSLLLQRLLVDQGPREFAGFQRATKEPRTSNVTCRVTYCCLCLCCPLVSVL